MYIPERDDHWIVLAKDQLGIPEHVLRDNIVNNDSISHYFFLHMTCEVIRTDSWNLIDLTFLSQLSKFDIQNAHPGLQNEFCDLWNEILLDARSRWTFLSLKRVLLLCKIRHHYIALHQGTEAAPIAFSASTVSANPLLSTIWAYPLCNISTHHANLSIPPPTHLGDPHHPSPSSTPLESQPVPGGSTIPQQVEEANIFLGLPSSAGYTSCHAQVFPTPLQATGPVHITPQAPSVTDASTNECIGMVPLNLNWLVATDASGLSHELWLPTAKLTANSVCGDERRLDRPINESGESPQTPATTSFTFPHLGPVLVTVVSPTVPRLPSVSVQQPGEFPRHSTAYYVVPYVFSPPRHQQPAGYSHAMCCIRHQSNLVYHLHQCYSTNERRINSRPAHYCIGLPIITHHDSGPPQW